MADNTQLNINTTAGDIIATDDIGGVKHELVKMEFGGDGVATQVSAANPLPVTEATATTIFNGKTTVTTAGTRVVLAASQAIKSVTVKALSTNTGFIYVGNATVASTNGYQLLAGDSISMDIANLNTVNIDSSVNGEGVSYIGIN